MRKLKVKEICDLQNGKAFKPSDWTSEGLPIIRIQNLNDETKPFNYCDGEVEEKYHIKNGDLLFSWSGTPGTSFGAFIWNRGEAYLNQHIYRVDIKNGTDTKFFKYALNSKLRVIIDQSHGGVGLKHITKKKLEKIEIPLPTLDEQKAIVAKLDRAQRLIEIDKEMLAKYDELIQSVFLEMFGDPVTNPKGWEIKKLGEVCDKITDGTHHSPKTYDEGVPYVTAKHVDPFKVDFYANPSYVMEEDHKKIYGRCDPEKGDVLLIKDGATTGKAAINPYDFEFSMLSSLALLKLDNSIIHGNYLINVLNDERFKDLIRQKYMSGVAIKRYTLKKINQFELPVPKIELQRKFNLVVEKVNLEKRTLTKSSKKSEELFSSLVQEAFN